MASNPTTWGSVYPGTDIVAVPEQGCVVEYSLGWGLAEYFERHYAYGCPPRGPGSPYFGLVGHSPETSLSECAPLLPSPAQATREQALAAFEAHCNEESEWPLEAGSLVMLDAGICYWPDLGDDDNGVHDANSAAVRRDLDKRDTLSAWWKQWDEVKHGEV